MATQAGELEVKLTLKQGEFQKMLGESQKQVQSFGTKVGSWVKENRLMLAAAFTAITVFAKKSVDAYGEQEVAVAKLVKALENQGIASDATVNHLQSLASELQNLTGYGDEAIISMQALLTTFGLQGDTLDRATRATLDMASAQGVDLTAAAQLVGKAFVGETGALSRYGIIVDKGLDSTQKFEAVMKQLETRFGGTAQATASTFAGQIKIMGAAFSDLQEEIGRMIAGDGARLVTWMTGVIQRVSQALSYISTVRQELGGFSMMIKMVVVEILRSIALTLVDLIAKVVALIGHLPLMGKASAKAGQEILLVRDAINAQIDAMQSSMDTKGRETAAALQGEKQKQAAFKNTAVQEVAIMDGLNLYIKDKLAEEVKLRADQQKELEQAKQKFAESFLVTEADMWDAATGMANQAIDAFGRGFAQMIMAGQKFSDVMNQIWKNMAEAVIAEIGRMIAKWLAFMAIKSAASAFGGPLGGVIGGFMAEGGVIAEPSVITGLRSGRTIMAGEAGPEMVVPTKNMTASEMGGMPGGGGGSVTINITGQFIEGDVNSWQRLMREKIIPEIRRFTMVNPTGPFNRRRGVV